MKIAREGLRPAYFEDVYGLCTVLYGERVAFSEGNAISTRFGRYVAHQDLAAAGIRLEPGGNVYRVADSGVLRAAIRSDVADRRHTRVQAYPHRNFGQALCTKFRVYRG